MADANWMQLVRRLGIVPATAAVWIAGSAAPGVASVGDPFSVEALGIDTRVITIGLEERAPGSPVVVFQSGAGSPVFAWETVLTGTSAFAPVVAYDRPGIGDSGFDGKLPTPAYVTRHLRALLDVLDAPPPYVLVGHSWGGPLIRFFAGEHPDDVVGLVYVDPTGLGNRGWLDRDVLRSLGHEEETLDDLETELASAISSWMTEVPEGILRENDVLQQYMMSDPASRFRPAPVVPTAVLLAARYEPMPAAPAFLDEAYHRASVESRMRWFQAHIANNPEATLVVATHAGHYVHDADPELVVEAIRRVTLPPPMPRLRIAYERGGVEEMVRSYEAIPAERRQENILNAIGYELLGSGDVDGAIVAFKLNTETYPESDNTWDSLGEAYAAQGDEKRAVASYEKSLAINPGNTNAERMLESLRE